MSTVARIGDALKSRGWTLAVAESCSGGLISHQITSAAGASEYFLGAVVSYSNEAKSAFLGVAEQSLELHGAVSEVVAREMAQGARGRFKADIALAVTGIAGPGGGSAEKPVGLVYLALATPADTYVERRVFAGNRAEVKAQSAARALNLIREHLA